MHQRFQQAVPYRDNPYFPRWSDSNHTGHTDAAADNGVPRAEHGIVDGTSTGGTEELHPEGPRVEVGGRSYTAGLTSMSPRTWEDVVGPVVVVALTAPLLPIPASDVRGKVVVVPSRLLPDVARSVSVEAGTLGGREHAWEHERWQQEQCIAWLAAHGARGAVLSLPLSQSPRQRRLSGDCDGEPRGGTVRNPTAHGRGQQPPVETQPRLLRLSATTLTQDTHTHTHDGTPCNAAHPLHAPQTPHAHHACSLPSLFLTQLQIASMMASIPDSPPSSQCVATLKCGRATERSAPGSNEARYTPAVGSSSPQQVRIAHYSSSSNTDYGFDFDYDYMPVATPRYVPSIVRHNSSSSGGSGNGNRNSNHRNSHDYAVVAAKRRRMLELEVRPSSRVPALLGDLLACLVAFLLRPRPSPRHLWLTMHTLLRPTG